MCVKHFVFESFDHMNKTVFVKGVCSGTALLLPYLVTFRKQEGFTEKVLDDSLKRSSFVRQLVFGPEYISNDARILNKELDRAA